MMAESDAELAIRVLDALAHRCDHVWSNEPYRGMRCDRDRDSDCMIHRKFPLVPCGCPCHAGY